MVELYGDVKWELYGDGGAIWCCCNGNTRVVWL